MENENESDKKADRKKKVDRKKQLRKAEAVIATQGQARRIAARLPDDVVDQLAELCDHVGLMIPGSRERYHEIMHAYYESQKATHDESDQV